MVLLSYKQARRLRKLLVLAGILLTILVLSGLYTTFSEDAGQERQTLYVPLVSSKGLESYEKKWVGFPQLDNVQCTPLFVKSTRNSLYPRFLPRVTAAQLATESQDCPTFLNKHGFHRYAPVTPEEQDFPLAYIILFHKDLYQVLFLLRAIYRPHNVYCLTVDLDSGPAFLAAVQSVVRCLPNVFLAGKMESIVYSGFSRFLADVHCMKELLLHPVPWIYLHNLPGQQFPLRTNLELVKIMKIYNGSNDIQGVIKKKSLPRRYKTVHRLILNNSTGKKVIVETAARKSPPPHDFRIVKGSAYGTFSRAFVEFVLTDSKVADLIEWSKDIESPDEYIFPTVHFSRIMHVPGGYRGPPEGKRFLATFASWENEAPCASMYVRWICILTSADLPMIVSQPNLFANKFYIDHYPATLHCLDQLLYNLTVTGTVRTLDFYRQLNFVRS